MNRADESANSSSLESAIRDKAENAIREIARLEAEQIKKLDEAYTAELEDFRKQSAARTDAKISQESARVKNRAVLEVRKLKLKRLEEFITRTVEEIAKGIRDNPRYKNFLLYAVRDAIRLIPKGAEIGIKKEDFNLEKDILQAVEEEGGRDASVREDRNIKWGGCIIVDAPGGRIFDGTIERACYRKSPVIRLEVMRALGNPLEGNRHE
jgi:flagellar biosynthesis/type III secretory pathway protein FliH